MSPRAAEEPSAQVSVPGTTCLPWGNDRGNWTADSVICVCVWFVCVQISLCVCACVCFCPLTPPCIPPILSLLVKNILRHKTTGKSWAEECLHQRPLTLWYSLSMLHVEKHNFLSECEVKEAKREKLHLKTPYCDVKGKILELNKPPNSDSKIFFLFFFKFICFPGSCARNPWTTRPALLQVWTAMPPLRAAASRRACGGRSSRSS